MEQASKVGVGLIALASIGGIIYLVSKAKAKSAILTFKLNNPPAEADHWRAIVMNGGIYYRNNFSIGEVGYVEVPEEQIPDMKTFVCMLYYSDGNLMERRDIQPPDGFTYGASYYYDWASNTFGEI